VRAVLRLWELPILLLALRATVLLAQEEPRGQEKKNPAIRFVEHTVLQQDTMKVPAPSVQRPLPKFDLPEYVITGTAEIDLPKLDKIMVDEPPVLQQTVLGSSGNILRDRATQELEMKSQTENTQQRTRMYSGFVKAGIGTYFMPQAELQFGQSFPDFYYILGGSYFLTKGYASNTDQSNGGGTVSGGTTLTSTISILQNAALHGNAGYQSKSFRFYGSASPDLQRTLSDFQLQAVAENQTLNSFPYSAGISLENVNISDSSSSKSETQFHLNYQTRFPIASLPITAAINGMSATGGLGFLDLSAGSQRYWLNDLSLGGSLHFYWAKGMAGQDFVRLCPQIMAGYQVSSQHRVFVLYEQLVVPMTLASHLITNRFLSAASIIKHETVTGAGELGVESNWTEAVQSRVTINVKSVSDLPMFSDFSHQGIWMLAYGRQTDLTNPGGSGRATIVTFCAEMVAKLNSNDYFASNMLLRSTRDSYLGGKIPYAPALEAWCSAIHRFGTTIAVSADVRFTGERTTDLTGKDTLSISKYAVVDVSGEYTPFDFLRLTIGIKNLTDTRYESWRGYREFPFTMQIDAQIKW